MVALDPAAVGADARSDYSALSQRLLNVVLFITILTSSLAFIEPSPHDVMMLVLLMACVVAHVRFERMLVPLFVMLLVWSLGVLMSLIQVGDDIKAVQYAGTSIYLDVAAVLFACLFSDGDAQRLAIVRRAYILSALIATAAGLVGFFHLVPGADIFLDIPPNSPPFSARVSATFKDPNVYGPFLIFPLLMLLNTMLLRGIGLLRILAMAVLLGGLFLSFSRGAWIHFVISAAVSVMLLLAATREPRQRARIVMLSALAAAAVGVLVLAMISVGSINEMFVERAKAVQDYDVGPGGRFTLQQLALSVIMEHPNGLGPFGFFHTYGTQQHNVYMESFLVYGWLGGTVYLTLIAMTLVVGLRAARLPAPWQPYLAAAYGVFVGEVVEGLIVDTDHWRHFYLILGMIWGLAAASIKLRWRSSYHDLAEPAPTAP